MWRGRWRGGFVGSGWRRTRPRTGPPDVALAAGGNDGDGKPSGHGLLNAGAHDDVGILTLAIDLLHDAVHLRHREVGVPLVKLTSTASASESTFPLSRNGWVASFWSTSCVRFSPRASTVASESFLMAAAQHGAEIIEIDVDQPGLGEQLPDAARTPCASSSFVYFNAS